MIVERSKVVSRNKHFRKNNHPFHSKMQRVIMLMNELELKRDITYVEVENTLLYTISAFEVIDKDSADET